MAYDEDLAWRLRDTLADVEGVTEKAMFGGLAFLLHGNMAIAASGRGGLMVRVGTDASQKALARPHTKQIEMRGRPMAGWIHVADEAHGPSARWKRGRGARSSSRARSRPRADPGAVRPPSLARRAPQRGDPALEEAPLRLRLRKLERPFVGALCLLIASRAPQQVCARGVEVAVVLER